KLTAEIGKYHAEALDGIGSLYYSEENYDDYYYGKGSTFPDVNGSVGILFEQGSSRGHIQESENGILTFPFTIRNQFTTALSTLKAANELKAELMNYQYEFFKGMAEVQRKSKLKGYVFGHQKDKAKTDHLAEILNRHQIQFHRLKKDVSVAGNNFNASSSYVVPLNQRNPRLIKAMFEKRTTFTDSLFYDISAWTFPLAFNLDYSEINNLDIAGEAVQSLQMTEGSVSAKSNYAYLFEWHEYYTPKALYQILSKGIRAKVAKSPFELNGKTYDYGTIMVPVVGQNKSKEELFELMKAVAKSTHISVDAVSTGLTRGIDLGSNEFDGVQLPKIALLVGEGIRSYDAGEIWHLMDTRYQIPITKIDLKTLPYADLSRYTDIIIAGFGYGSSRISEGTVKKIKSFVQDGGSVIAYRNSANWLDSNGFLNLEFKRNSMVAKNVSFEQRNDFRGAQNTGGAIFEAHIDRTHPINFGFTSDKISLFRNTNIYLKADKQSYNNPIQYTSNPLQSGYISEENLELIKNSVPLKVNRLGRGKVILFTDNTNFRAFWYGTNKLLANAIFFGDSM
ncbi:MAG: zinc carboxypeptidase, partial [Flavobacteriaceae bacterium]